MAATMRDVARAAGVSVKTVSNVVNSFPHVSAATRARVLAAIDELGYQMNFAARSLSLGRTGMITLAVPRLSLPYFAELSDEVIDAAAARGYTVLIEQTGGSRERELAVLSSERRRMTDGLIMSPVGLRAPDAPSLEVDFPLVLLGERPLRHVVDHVAMDNVAGARAATEHLLAHGCRRIAIIGSAEPTDFGAATLRTRGFLAALAAAGADHDPDLTGEALTWTRAEGARAMAAVLDRGVVPDGVLALNDVLALGALSTLHDRGLRVPDDVAVAGFDDIEEGRFVRPSLTTVDPGRPRIAAAALDLLVGRIATGPGARGPEEPAREVVAPFGLRVRQSTGGPAAAADDASRDCRDQTET